MASTAQDSVPKDSVPKDSAAKDSAAKDGVLRISFRTVILRAGKTATGIEVPAELVAKLGASKRPPVRVTVNGHTYRSTVAVMGGKFMVDGPRDGPRLQGSSWMNGSFVCQCYPAGHAAR